MLFERDRSRIWQMVGEMNRKPLISVILPVYNVDEKWLRLCVDSVINQLYPVWELCIADDCSTAEHIRPLIEEYAARDRRIKIVFRPQNGHISAASNSALELASGEFTVLLDHDDELAADALFWVAHELNTHPKTKMIYSDEDLIDAKGRHSEPKFKPDFSRDLFYSLNLITHLSGYRTDLLREIGGFRTGFEGSQDYDIALRVIERITEEEIRHIPRILYHWRAIRGSVAFSGDEKPYAHARAREALREHFARTGKKAAVERSEFNLHRVRYDLPAELPKVSLIFAAIGEPETMKKLVNRYAELTDYSNLEIFTVSNEEMQVLPELPGVQHVVCEGIGLSKMLNLAASQANGEVLCFADISLMPRTPDWLKEMVSFAISEEIGAVGAKLLFADETILHGGLVIGAGDVISIAHYSFPGDYGGIMGRNIFTGNFSAVSAACMAVRRKIFEELGGFDDNNWPNHLFDVDLCLRMRQRKLRIIYAPFAELIKIDENRLACLQEPPASEEKTRFHKKWQKYIDRDPFYNPNLSKKDASFSIDV